MSGSGPLRAGHRGHPTVSVANAGRFFASRRGVAEALLSRLVHQLRAAIGAEPSAPGFVPHQAVQDIVADFPACVLIADATGQLVAASEQTLQTLGYTMQSLRELDVTELAPGDEEEEVQLLWEAFRRQRRQSGRFTLRHKNGTLIHTHYAATTNAVAGLSAAVHVVDTDTVPTSTGGDGEAS